MEPEKNNQSTPVSPESTADANEPSSSQSSDVQTEPAKDSSEGVMDNKVLAIVGYILPFLFFLPLLNDKSKEDSFARFHANQQLILLIFIVLLSFIRQPLMMIFMSLSYFIMDIINIVILVMAILGAYNAYRGEMKELPIIGKFRLLK